MLHTEIKIKSAKWPAKFAAALEKGVFHVKHVSTLLLRRKNEKKFLLELLVVGATSKTPQRKNGDKLERRRQKIFSL